MAFVPNTIKRGLAATINVFTSSQQFSLGPFLDEAGDPIDLSGWDDIRLDIMPASTANAGAAAFLEELVLSTADTAGYIKMNLDGTTVSGNTPLSTYPCNVVGRATGGDDYQLLGTGTCKLTVSQ